MPPLCYGGKRPGGARTAALGRLSPFPASPLFSTLPCPANGVPAKQACPTRCGPLGLSRERSGSCSICTMRGSRLPSRSRVYPAAPVFAPKLPQRGTGMGTEALWAALGWPAAVWPLQVACPLVPSLPGTGQGTWLGGFHSPPSPLASFRCRTALGSTASPVPAAARTNPGSCFPALNPPFGRRDRNRLHFPHPRQYSSDCKNLSNQFRPPGAGPALSSLLLALELFLPVCFTPPPNAAGAQQGRC